MQRRSSRSGACRLGLSRSFRARSPSKRHHLGLPSAKKSGAIDLKSIHPQGGDQRGAFEELSFLHFARPYRSQGVPIASVEPGPEPGYGDWGRYVMAGHMHNFQSRRLREKPARPVPQRLLSLSSKTSRSFSNFLIDHPKNKGVSSVTFITNDLTKNISKAFASDLVVALRGYVRAHWQTRIRVRRPGNQYAAEFRERRPYQGGQQVVQDLTQIIEISRTLPA